LKRMRFRIPTMLEIWDEHCIEKNIYFIDSSDRIYVTRLRWRCAVLKAAEGGNTKRILPRDSRDKRGILKPRVYWVVALINLKIKHH